MSRTYNVPAMWLIVFLTATPAIAASAKQGVMPGQGGADATAVETILQVLDAADSDFQADRLLLPANNNAFEKYQRVLELDPDNLRARQGLKRIVLRYVALARSALSEKEVDQVQALLDRAEQVQQALEALAGLRAEHDRPGLGPGHEQAQPAEGIRPSDEGPQMHPAQAQPIDAKVVPAVQEDPTPDPLGLRPQVGKDWTEPITGMEFVWVPGGCFLMGCGPWAEQCRDNEQPVHELCLDGFWMGRYEVTQAQWEQVMGDNPSRFKGPDNPVDSISWHMAQEFIKNLNSRSVEAGHRLPTEAQWEYACRGGGAKETYCGGANANEVAWHLGNSGGRTHPVGRKTPNALGLFDMSGNVAEWCVDAYDADAYSRPGQTYASAVAGGVPDRVFRGGAWNMKPWGVRAAFRNRNAPGLSYSAVGLRLVKTP